VHIVGTVSDIQKSINGGESLFVLHDVVKVILRLTEWVCMVQQISLVSTVPHTFNSGQPSLIFLTCLNAQVGSLKVSCCSVCDGVLPV